MFNSLKPVGKKRVRTTLTFKAFSYDPLMCSSSDYSQPKGKRAFVGMFIIVQLPGRYSGRKWTLVKHCGRLDTILGKCLTPLLDVNSEQFKPSKYSLTLVVLDQGHKQFCLAHFIIQV